ncbi:MAG: MFS transporter [Elusimicrobia bacterium]|nr:MFS transporter [Elusimicrobiota bacterium]
MKDILKNYAAALRAFRPNARRFLAFTFLLSLAQSVYGLVFNLYILKTGYTMDFVGTLGAIPGLTVAALSIPLAVLTAGLPARRMLLVSVGLSSAVMLGMAVFTGRAPLMLLAVLGGAAGALMGITSAPLMARSSSQEERQHFFSFQFAASMVAAFAGSLSAGWLTRGWAALFCAGEENAAAYRLTLFFACLLMLAAARAAAAINEPDAAGKDSEGGFAELNKGLALYVLLPQLMIGFGAGMIMPYLNIFFKSGFSLNIASLGVCMSLMPLAMAVGGLIGPLAVRRLGQVRTMIFFQSLSIPFLATMGFSGLLVPTVMAAFARTMLMNASWPVYSVFMLGHFPASQHQAVSSIYSAGWNLANAASTRLSGRLQMDFGFTLPFLITITCYAAATLLLSRRFLRTEKANKKAAGPAAPEEGLE